MANAELLKDFIVPTAARLASDPIPNIRFNVAKTFSAVIPIVKKLDSVKNLLNDPVKTSLNKLQDDSDADVRYYAQKALALI